ncbi:response regulator transcription factor [Mucilaginibacter rubeus]|uniref:Response regulator transcription factor n=1 Tax=Mucilaginibacter rubeus TaxID=2027860 RepID=A0AAE6JCE8_9SPHI|nr:MULTISPECIES: response regulator transcription factor [Mucilaginibacter]QEM03025.1 response regulator transcription factor [Mucilaginibacter rubeus]QEM15643.1 response regulator transcription factor [Mucilaginibacter gossypii]QTE41622.1 response regulator transcription factor [Mucilaginibacter rubeus]QTE48227.1 response regulator transcription factor [Mucilaginibacter rubeus]QTE59615.1 response regulator transcription factor [Mucilaginibacter rubeus]
MESTVEKLSVIIADDHTLFINGLHMLLQGEPDIEVMSVAANGKELLHLLHTQTPNLILLDINMPGMNGFDVLKRIKDYYPKIKVIMLSTYNEEHLIEKAKAEGASGYLFKNVGKAELLQVMSSVAQGQLCFPCKQPVVNSMPNEPDPFLKQFQLTKRETELLQFIKQNFTNQQMADHLHLSIYTVETHRKNIMQKLNLKNPVELNRFIMQYNL